MRLSHVHAIVRWLEDFEKVKVLGVGGTGIVYELLHKSNGQRYAMKEMEIKNKSQMQMAISEAEMLKDIMENVSHPNIMHIEKVFQVGSKFYLVFPLCTGGELYEHIIRKGNFG
jgi:calcium-dependent protein kinase